MKYEYDAIDREHASIMEALAVPCRSDKNGFKAGKTQRIDKIRTLLGNSGYHEILLPGVQIWRRDFSSPINLLISSHADVVNSIKHCSSSLSEDGYYEGTYDNAGTNSAAVIAMLKGDLPTDVVFAFTSDEETGRCNGAKQALEYVRNLGNEPLCIALDVTSEGYDEGLLFTVENLTSGHKKNEDKEFLNMVANTALSLEPEGLRTFSFVKLHKSAVPDVFPKEYLSKGTGWFDEAQAYAEQHAKTFSLCLPCDGYMHGEAGVSIRQPGFEGYINALESVIYSLTQTHEQLIEAKRMENASLHTKIAGMVEEEEKQARKWYQSYYSSYSSYDDYYDWEAELRDYNASFGITDEEPLCYSPEAFPSFEDYVNAVIDDIYESAYEYQNEYQNAGVDLFVEDMASFAPPDIITYMGGEDKFRGFVRELYEAEFMEEETGEYSTVSLPENDEGGAEIMRRVQEIEEGGISFSLAQKDALIRYAKAVDDTDAAAAKADYLAKIISQSPQIAEKETRRLRNEVDDILAEKSLSHSNILNFEGIEEDDTIEY